MNKKPKLGAIVIGVANIERAKEFYVNVLEIEIDSQDSNYLSAYLGDTHIELEEDSPSRFPNWAKYHIGTYKSNEFIVADMNNFLKKVKSHGGKVVSEPIARPWGTIGAEIADPDGNMFMIIQEK